MKKKLLFFAPNDYDIDITIYDHLMKRNDYEVFKLMSEKYKYKNIFERILNLYGKIFLKKILKNEWKLKIQLNQLKTNDPFEVCLIIRPDLLDKKILEYLKNSIPTRKVVYWDSFKKISDSVNTLYYFNEHYSFEKDDCKEYKLNLISNFYVHKSSNKTPKLDALFFGAKDFRLEKIKLLFKYLNKKGWKAKALLVGKKTRKDKTDGVEIIKKGIPFSEIYKLSQNTKVVIDIAHPNQKGLSMRPYEALGLERKLITNNSEVKKYDFYNPNNIYIIEDFDNLDIPNSFLEQPYEKISEDIYNKYHISCWLNNILG